VVFAAVVALWSYQLPSFYHTTTVTITLSLLYNLSTIIEHKESQKVSLYAMCVVGKSITAVFGKITIKNDLNPDHKSLLKNEKS